MKKRGQTNAFSIKAQTTIFIIIAIIIVVAVAGYLYLNNENITNPFSKTSINTIEDSLLNCLETTSKQALELIGVQGGYYKEPEYRYDFEWAFIPYYYYQGQFLMPEKQTIQDQLSLYIDENMPSCIDTLNFKDYDLKYSQPKTQTSIQPSRVTFTTDMPITISHDSTTTTFELSQYPLTLNSSLNEILEVAEYITDSHKENKDMMCINCITEMAKERDLYVDFISFEEDSTLVMILKNSTSNDPYIFEFLNKYNVTQE